jgi:hypothetical protein
LRPRLLAKAKRKFYGDKRRHGETDGQRPELDLAGAARLAGLEQEIELLRALVKRAVQTGHDDEVRRLVQALCSALRLQRALAGEPVASDRQLLEELLDDVEKRQAAAVLGGD